MCSSDLGISGESSQSYLETRMKVAGDSESTMLVGVRIECDSKLTISTEPVHTSVDMDVDQTFILDLKEESVILSVG